MRLARCPTGATPTTADDLRKLDEQTLQPAPPPPRQGPPPRSASLALDQSVVSTPPENPLASDCRYVGFQTEWLASKRDTGLPLSEALAAARRIFARDLPWQSALFDALGTRVYRDPQRSPAELRQALEAECLVHPLRWTERRTDW